MQYYSNIHPCVILPKEARQPKSKSLNFWSNPRLNALNFSSIWHCPKETNIQKRAHIIFDQISWWIFWKIPCWLDLTFLTFVNCSLSFTIKGKHHLLIKGDEILSKSPSILLFSTLNLEISSFLVHKCPYPSTYKHSFPFLIKPSTIKVSWLATISPSPPWPKIAKFLYQFIPTSPYICSPTHIRVVSITYQTSFHIFHHGHKNLG